MISPPDFTKYFIIYISASTYVIASVLIQKVKDHQEHVIYYLSKSLSSPSINYGRDEKVALVVISSWKQCHYILLHKTRVVTNSNPMQYILGRQLITGKFVGRMVIFQQFNLEFSTPKTKKGLALV